MSSKLKVIVLNWNTNLRIGYSADGATDAKVTLQYGLKLYIQSELKYSIIKVDILIHAHKHVLGRTALNSNTGWMK